jgi:3,4-dihydroxy 2-butanone 4-phosphate synthase / GTP cyclohydrolase II
MIQKDETLLRNFSKRMALSKERCHLFDLIEEALDELSRGRVIIVCDDEDRENEGDFIALAEKTTPDVINFMVTEGRGLVCVPIEKELAKKLQLEYMVSNNTDSHGTAFTVSIDHITTTTGISAFERSTTVLKMLEHQAKPSDFKRPGHMFPLISKPGGVLERPGHTEAAIDLAKLCGAFPAGVICEVLNTDGTMARVPELRKIADQHNLKMITIKNLIKYLEEKKEPKKEKLRTTL